MTIKSLKKLITVGRNWFHTPVMVFEIYGEEVANHLINLYDDASRCYRETYTTHRTVRC